MAYGGSVDEFKKAFADVDPIEINTQYPAAKSSPVDKVYEDCYAYLDIPPGYEPDQYPANAALADTSFVGSRAPWHSTRLPGRSSRG